MITKLIIINFTPFSLYPAKRITKPKSNPNRPIIEPRAIKNSIPCEIFVKYTSKIIFICICD